VVYIGYGKISSQTPAAGARIRRDEKVHLKMEFH
jgi:beta-lactam-binding protein with PASTA domain